MLFIRKSKEEKIAFSKKFTKEQIESYKKGKRLGFLEGVHKKPKSNAVNERYAKPLKINSYTSEELAKMFDDINSVEI